MEVRIKLILMDTELDVKDYINENFHLAGFVNCKNRWVVYPPGTYLKLSFNDDNIAHDAIVEELVRISDNKYKLVELNDKTIFYKEP